MASFSDREKCVCVCVFATRREKIGRRREEHMTERDVAGTCCVTGFLAEFFTDLVQ